MATKNPYMVEPNNICTNALECDSMSTWYTAIENTTGSIRDLTIALRHTYVPVGEDSMLKLQG